MRWGLVPSFAKRPEDYDLFKGGASTFNARVETVQTSNLWRRLIEKHRGVVMLDGFYEWQVKGKSKAPMFIRLNDSVPIRAIPGVDKVAEDKLQAEALCDSSLKGVQMKDAEGSEEPKHAPLLLAALHDVWAPTCGKEGKEGETDEASKEQILESATILTMDSLCTPMEKIHDRMPVFLTPEMAATWLDSSKSFADIVGPVLKSAVELAKSDLHIYEVSSLVSNIRNESPECVLPKKSFDAQQLSKGLGRFFKRKAEELENDAPRKAPKQ